MCIRDRFKGKGFDAFLMSQMWDCQEDRERIFRAVSYTHLDVYKRQEKSCSLCGELGSQFMIDEWEYPAIGVAICDCPSAGHDMIFLDYRDCGRCV